MKSTKGFTLIELVVVIVILGILAATALPKFVDLGSDARKAAVRALAGTLKSGAELAHAKCVTVAKCVMQAAPNDSTSVVGNVQILGPDGTLGYMFNGYPTGKTRTPTNYFGIKDWVDFSGFTPTEDPSYTIFKKDGATRPDNCQVTYTQNYTVGQQPTITFDDTGC